MSFCVILVEDKVKCKILQGILSIRVVKFGKELSFFKSKEEGAINKAVVGLIIIEMSSGSNKQNA